MTENVDRQVVLRQVRRRQVYRERLVPSAHFEDQRHGQWDLFVHREHHQKSQSGEPPHLEDFLVVHIDEEDVGHGGLGGTKEKRDRGLPEVAVLPFDVFRIEHVEVVVKVGNEGGGQLVVAPLAVHSLDVELVVQTLLDHDKRKH